MELFNNKTNFSPPLPESCGTWWIVLCCVCFPFIWAAINNEQQAKGHGNMVIIAISRAQRGIIYNRLQHILYSMEDVTQAHFTLYVQYSSANRSKLSDTLCQRLLHIISVGKFKLAKGLRVKHHVWRGSSISTTQSKVSAVSNHIQGNPANHTCNDPSGSRGCLKKQWTVYVGVSTGRDGQFYSHLRKIKSRC